MNTTRPTIAETLAESKGLTVSQIAEQVGLSESAVRNILKGRCAPNVYAAGRIAKLFNVPIERIWPIEAA